jgi:peptidoglycan/LPS O-acetylase OafA/YrhL
VTRDRTIEYQPGLDGLRAVAVAAVLLYHVGGRVRSTLAHGGFLGVDVFFVLSGYLITTLLLEERFASGRIRLGGFWARRARRLVPALVLVLLLVAVLARLVYPAGVADLARGDVVWVLGYAQNWHLAAFHGAGSSPLAPAWSLSVEEQFYFLWPLVLLALVAWLGPDRRRLFLAMVALVVVGSVWAAWRFEVGGTSTYFATDTRAPELFVGAGLAVLGLGRGLRVPARVRPTLDVGGLVLLSVLGVVLVTARNGPMWHYGGFVLLALATAVVIAAAVQPTGPVRAVLGLAPLVAIGRISYGLYLFHFPVYAWIGPLDGRGPVAKLIVRLGVTAALATVSFVLVEQPIRQRRLPERVVVPVGAGLAAIAIVAVAGVASPPPTPRSPVLAYALRSTAAQAPPGARRVLVVGGDGIARFSAAGGTVGRIGHTVGVATGTPGCGLLGSTAACRAVPDDLTALVLALDADVVVLAPDREDLAVAEVASRRLEALRRRVAGRQLVVLRLPCTTPDPPARRRFDRAVARWAEARGVRMAASPLGRCGGSASGDVRGVWATLGRVSAAR